PDGKPMTPGPGTAQDPRPPTRVTHPMPTPRMQETLFNQSTMIDLDNIRVLTAADARAVDHYIHDQLRSEVVLINQLGQYIVNSGGKRLRPLLVLLAARACGYQGEQHI